jgi:hypothetical protein
VRDIPDLSFDLESLDVSCELEALLCAVDPTTVVNGDEFDFTASHVPADIISPFKSGNGAFDIVRGVAVPSLTLESISYRFGVRQNAGQNVTLKGDAIYYIPGAPKMTTVAVTAGTNQAYAFGGTSIAYTEQGNTLYAYAVCAFNATTKTYKRLFFGDNYTNTATGITVLDNLSTLGYTSVRMVWGTTTATSYLSTVHQGVSVKPASVRGKDLDVYVSDSATTPNFIRWTGVQSVECTRRVTLQQDEELGNTHYVSQDYDVPEVSGSIVVKPADAPAMWEKLQYIASTTGSVVTGAHSSVGLPLEMRINHPDTGVLLKTIYVPDARFTLPGYQGRVQQKLEQTFAFKSDSGDMKVYRGARP